MIATAMRVAVTVTVVRLALIASLIHSTVTLATTRTSGGSSGFIDYVVYRDHTSGATHRGDVFRDTHPTEQARQFCNEYSIDEDHCSVVTSAFEDVYRTYTSLEDIPRHKKFAPPVPLNTSDTLVLGAIPLTLSPDNRRVKFVVTSGPDGLPEQVRKFCERYDIVEGFCSVLREKAYEIYDNHHPISATPLRHHSVYSLERQLRELNWTKESPLKILINSHPCSGKSYFLERYDRKYKLFYLEDIDDFTTYPIRHRYREILSRPHNVVLLGSGHDSEDSNVVMGVVHVWVFPPLPDIHRNIISRQIGMGSSCDSMHVWANPRNVLRSRAQCRFLNIPPSDLPAHDMNVDNLDLSILPEFDSFEGALDAVLDAMTRYTPNINDKNV